MKFNINSGANVAMITDADYLEAGDGPLQSLTTVLRGPSSISLFCLRQVLWSADYKDIFIIKYLQAPY